jgi:hypothetical protein
MRRWLPVLGVLLLCAVRADAQAVRTDEEQVIAIALQKAIGDRAVPDYALAVKKGHLVLRDSAAVASEPVTMLPITESLLPHVEGLKIDRLPVPKIRDRAEHGEPLVYVSVWKLEVRGSEAFVTVSTGWMVGKKKKQNFIPMSGGGIRMRVVRQEGAWKFDKIVEQWIS